jgi:hypothetical protein
MSDLQVLLWATVAVVVVGLVGIITASVRALRVRVPEAIRAKYPKRVIDRSQMPLTEEWMESVDPNDVPVLVRARTRKSVLLIAGVIFVYLVLFLRLLQLHIVIRMLTDHAH